MVKTRVHDLAAEFGIAPEQLLGMLKDMNIFVRSHLSALESDQVSAIRVRWEREKRKSAEEPGAKKGRRKAAKAEPAPVPVEPDSDALRALDEEIARLPDGLRSVVVACEIDGLGRAEAAARLGPRQPRLLAQQFANLRYVRLVFHRQHHVHVNHEDPRKSRELNESLRRRPGGAD